MQDFCIQANHFIRVELGRSAREFSEIKPCNERVKRRAGLNRIGRPQPRQKAGDGHGLQAFLVAQGQNPDRAEALGQLSPFRVRNQR